MKGITRKEHCPTDLERICYGDDGEMTAYDYLGSGDVCEVKSDVDREVSEVKSNVDYEVSGSAREFIREAMSLDRRHLFDIIALANRAARELHDAGIA